MAAHKRADLYPRWRLPGYVTALLAGRGPASCASQDPPVLKFVAEWVGPRSSPGGQFVGMEARHNKTRSPTREPASFGTKLYET